MRLRTKSVDRNGIYLFPQPGRHLNLRPVEWATHDAGHGQGNERPRIEDEGDQEERGKDRTRLMCSVAFRHLGDDRSAADIFYPLNSAS